MYDILYLLSPDNLVHHLKESVESRSRTEPDCRLEELHLWNVECICGMWNAFTDKVEGYICIDGVWEMQRVVTVNSGERPRQLGKSK